MFRLPSAFVLLLAFTSWPGSAQVVSPNVLGTPQIAVFHAGGRWTLKGVRNTVILNESDLSVSISSGPVIWKMLPSSNQDMLVDVGGHLGIDEFHLRLADAGEIRIVPYATGFKTGIKITLGKFRNAGQVTPGSPLNVRLILTMCLDGEDEELVSEATVQEHSAVARELNWPTAIDGRDVD